MMYSLKDFIIDKCWEIYKDIYENKFDVDKEMSEIDSNFMMKFRSWDKSDCSFVGILKVYLWYVASIDNEDPWMQDEHKELIKFLDKVT